MTGILGGLLGDEQEGEAEIEAQAEFRAESDVHFRHESVREERDEDGHTRSRSDSLEADAETSVEHQAGDPQRALPQAPAPLRLSGPGVWWNQLS